MITCLGKGSGLNIACIYPTWYILTLPRISSIITGSSLLDKPVPPLNPDTMKYHQGYHKPTEPRVLVF